MDWKLDPPCIRVLAYRNFASWLSLLPFINLPVYFVLLCNCSVSYVVSVKNENYKKKKEKKKEEVYFDLVLELFC